MAQKSDCYASAEVFACRNRRSAYHRLEPRSLSSRPIRVGVAPGGQCPLSNGRQQNVIGTSICRKPLLFNANTQTKAFVAPGRDLITFLLVCGDATNIRHEYTGFPRHVGADVP